MRSAWLLALAAIASVATLTCSSEEPESVVAKGEKLYAENCALCHGTRGEGYRADEAPRLASDEFLRHANDNYLRVAILQGRPGTTMSAWSKERGGPLDPAGADAIIALMRTWQTSAAVVLDPAPVTGDARRAEPVFASECRECHGDKGEEGRYAQIGNPVFLASASDAFIRAAIERGRPETPMPAFAGRLDATAIADVVALVRSWQRPVDGPETLPPGPGKLEDVVINPAGPEPDFDPRARYVPADTVKAAMDRGASFVLADARPPSDYSGGHIAGAISLPFFAVDDYLSQIPKDRYVITYCACPHAESEIAAQKLRFAGYSRVAVLDEGFKVWRQRGYAVKSGGKP